LVARSAAIATKSESIHELTRNNTKSILVGFGFVIIRVISWIFYSGKTLLKSQAVAPLHHREERHFIFSLTQATFSKLFIPLSLSRRQTPVPRTFDCPKCGAPVSYSENPTTTVRCNYCGSVLAEPNPAMGQAARIVQVRIDASHARAGLKGWLLVILIVPAIGLLVGGIALVVGLIPMLRTGNSNVPGANRSNRTSPLGGTSTTSGPATILLKFGSEGIGAGMFTDARSIAVDGSGKIYVG